MKLNQKVIGIRRKRVKFYSAQYNKTASLQSDKHRKEARMSRKEIKIGDRV
ncbi:MAG: hypothetical protein WBF33_33320 [Candidatus Nitrosopolaris sp.]